MFISKLNERMNAYDPYGEQRLNGVKVVYIILIMYAVNAVLPIPNPYFYFFYVPMFCMLAEIAGQTIEEKYRYLFHCMLISIITVFVFDYFAVFWFIFVLVFFYSLLLYFSVINNQVYVVSIVPIALAMGAYSLLFEELNTSFYFLLNNCLTLLLAMVIIFAALIFFPLSYYYRLWLRALLLLTQQVIDHASIILKHQDIIFDPVTGHTTRLFRYANMLPHNFPAYSILKISYLINDLHLLICVPEHEELNRDENKIKSLISELTIFKATVEQEKPCELKNSSFKELDKLIHSWNYLCLSL